MHLLQIVLFLVVVLIDKDSDVLCVFLAARNEVAIVGELVVGVARRLGQPVVARIQHNVSLLVVYDDFESEQQQAVLFVDVVCDRAELLVSESVRNLFSVDFKGLALPVLRQPSPVALVLLLELFIWVTARLNDVTDQRD